MRESNIEQWRAIKGFEGRYAVSNLGNVKSVERTVVRKDGRKQHVRERILKPTKNNKDYLNVGLHKNGVQKKYGVHVLVAQAYPEICGEWFEGAVCDHLDRDTTHNNALNIRVGTQKDNMNNPLTKKAMCEGQQKRTNYKGLKEKCSKTVYQYSKDTHELVKEWQSAHEVQRQMGWDNGNISACCLGKKKTAYKYIWSYEPLTA